MELKDEVIKKALECCGDETGLSWCSVCPYYDRGNDLCQENLSRDSLALINRQQAEIERLELLLNQLFKDVDYKLQYIYELEKKLESDQSEAIKEFVERLKIDWQENDFYWEDADVYKWIDNLVKEMVGGENEKNS